MTEITTVARRIARRHNEHVGGALSGGRLLFDKDGTGGCWFSANTNLQALEEDGQVVFPVLPHRITYRQAQKWLDGEPI